MYVNLRNHFLVPELFFQSQKMSKFLKFAPPLNRLTQSQKRACGGPFIFFTTRGKEAGVIKYVLYQGNAICFTEMIDIFWFYKISITAIYKRHVFGRTCRVFFCGGWQFGLVAQVEQKLKLVIFSFAMNSPFIIYLGK